MFLLSQSLLNKPRITAILLGVLSINAAHGQQSVAGCNSAFQPAQGVYDFVQGGTISPDFDESAQFGTVHITRLPIFNEADPDENITLFRWANQFHLLTRDDVVRRQLLFEPGQPYEPRLVEESGRLLRAQGYLYDADIRPVSECGGEVEVEVITKDTWSLTPNIALDRFGGENTFSFGLRDSNFLGRGKLLAINADEDIDQRSLELAYRDNNVFGSRIRNSTTLVDSDEGERFQFDTDLPFFSLDSRRSWAVRLHNETRRDAQHFRGEEVSAVMHGIDDYTFEIGTSAGLIDGVAWRWRFGLRYRQDEFSMAAELPAPAKFPDNKRLSYPYFSLSSVRDEFATAFNLDQIYRTEDLQLGRQWTLTLGYAAEILGSDTDRLVMRGEYSDTLNYNGDILWQHGLSFEGLWNLPGSQSEDLLVKYENRFFHRRTDRRAFFVGFEAQYSQNLSSNRQILLGATTGTRAFDNRFQAGDRMVLLTLEERLYTDIHLFNLIRLGGAVFLDAGRAWEPGQDDGLRQDWLADIGFGLRLASSKAASDRVAHLDFAFPLTNRNDPKVDEISIAFTVKGSF